MIKKQAPNSLKRKENDLGVCTQQPLNQMINSDSEPKERLLNYGGQGRVWQ